MKTKRKPKKEQEKLSVSELKQLMGMGRQTYERRSGAIRRKGGK
ncbi:hypothetical protein [Aureibacillus halotolerans]|nr:hypothetical protein [Aureibacillus halotolerans]